jgi:hypothetical protein
MKLIVERDIDLVIHLLLKIFLGCGSLKSRKNQKANE